VPSIAVALPALQRPVVGALERVVPLDAPHRPSVMPVLTSSGALQDAVVPSPPPLPEQDQLQGPVPDTADAVPVAHRPVVGALATATASAAPHAPSTTGVLLLLALQDAVVPPELPSQLQVQGPMPATAVAVPVVQRPVVGALATVVPLAEPHAPLTAGALTLALQDALVPLPLPEQLQAQGPLPETAVAVPVVHRLVVGALVTLVPLAAPHAPLTTVVLLLAVQNAVAPEPLPEQDQLQGPVPDTAVAVPATQRPVVGALATVVSSAAPHSPLTTEMLLAPALQEAVVPPGLPEQLQVQGSLPDTAVAVPVVHKPVVGALVGVVPLAVPQAPLTTVVLLLLALQDAVAPEPLPEQFQVQGPLPETAVAVPVVQRPVVGALATVVSLAEPHTPLTAGALSLALQDAVVPPELPSQLQLQGPLPDTEVAVPVSQRSAAGALATVVPLAAPHAPSTATGLLLLALHDEFVPLVPLPSQLQVQGPLPDTAVAVPVVHRPVVGALATVVPLAAPHTPLLAASGASHDALVPLLAPSQRQLQGPLPEIFVAVPVVHKPVVGVLATATPLAAPHCPGVQAGAGVPL
jgi:hypothetical protein